MTGPPSISATPVSEFSIKAIRDRRGPRSGSEPNRSHHRWWNTVRPVRRPSAVDTGRRCLIRGWVGSDPLCSRIADSTRPSRHPGRSAFRWPLIPSRVYWIDNHRTRHESDSILSGWRVGPAGGTIQGRIRQTETFCNHRFLCLRSGQLRNRIHLIQTQLTSREPGTKHRQILQSPRHPDQLSCRRMPETKPGRHPLRKIPSPIRQEPLTPISIDQPFTDLGVENGQTREQMRQDPIGLIVSETLPLHHPNVRTRCDRIRVRNRPFAKKSQKSSAMGRPTVRRPEARGPSRCRSSRPGSQWRRGPWRRSSGQRRRERRRGCPAH